jgi:tRNA(fMet)-specific endonuclease VapC
MSARYLVDTDWVIHWLNGHEKIRRRLDEVKERGLAVSVISLAEIYEGVYYGRNPKTAEEGLRDFLTGADLLSIDQATAETFGRERGRLRAIRKIIGDFDLMIAATALRFGLTLLTNNRRHFNRIESLRMESV